MDVVDRRVLEDHDSGRHLDVGLDEFQYGAACRAVVLRIDQRLLNIVEPADGEEVVLLVVIERRFLAQPPLHGIRIRVNIAVVGVIRNVGRRAHQDRLHHRQAGDGRPSYPSRSTS